ncbi:MAG: hypothetical protein RIR62_1185 [Pseudomonadota bacterium]
MRRWSLRRRLLVWLLAATAVLGAFALADTRAEALRTAQNVSDRVLAGSALAIAEGVSVDLDGGLQVDIPYSALEMLTSTAQDQVFYRVDGPAGFITGYDRLSILPEAEAEMRFADGRFGAVPIRIASLTRSVSAGDGSLPFTVTVAESTLARDALARAILWRSALRLSLMIAAAGLIVWIAVTLAMRPLNRLGEVIAQRAPDDLRPVTADTPDEVAGLVEAVNSFMARLDTVLAALRNFTGNASHQLRTPLSVVRTQLALAARSGTEDGRLDATAKADAALARAERILAQLLVLARVDAATGRAAGRIDVAALARDLTAEMVPAAAERGVDLGYAGAQGCEVAAEPVLVSEMLHNLIDNAILYAGKGAEVTVRVTADRVLEVADDGPGIPPERRAELSATARAPHADTRQGGYGLGLAIAHEIAALFGAAITLAAARADGRGLCVRIAFPPPP